MKRLILTGIITLVLAVVAVVAMPQVLHMDTAQAATPSDLLTKPACEDIKKAGGDVAGCTKAGDLQNQEDGTPAYLTTLTNAFIYIGGLVSVVFLVIGGIGYITSTGDRGRVESAKKTITYAVAGLVVVALARVIIGFVIGTLGQ
ncbi:hypothetical protein EPO04_03225 [Patescibacteria group bacterium]|nr:MAG: hypothetical protein EPO04_03225 [Patescibacteria group bacterium]